MDKAQILGRDDVRDDKSSLYRLCRLLLMNSLCTLLTAHPYTIVILRVGLFVDFILVIVKVKKRLHRKAKRLLFVPGGPTNAT